MVRSNRDSEILTKIDTFFAFVLFSLSKKYQKKCKNFIYKILGILVQMNKKKVEKFWGQQVATCSFFPNLKFPRFWRGF